MITITIILELELGNKQIMISKKGKLIFGDFMNVNSTFTESSKFNNLKKICSTKTQSVFIDHNGDFYINKTTLDDNYKNVVYYLKETGTRMKFIDICYCGDILYMLTSAKKVYSKIDNELYYENASGVNALYGSGKGRIICSQEYSFMAKGYNNYNNLLENNYGYIHDNNKKKIKEFKTAHIYSVNKYLFTYGTSIYKKNYDIQINGWLKDDKYVKLYLENNLDDLRTGIFIPYFRINDNLTYGLSYDETDTGDYYLEKIKENYPRITNTFTIADIMYVISDQNVYIYEQGKIIHMPQLTSYNNHCDKNNTTPAITTQATYTGYNNEPAQFSTDNDMNEIYDLFSNNNVYENTETIGNSMYGDPSNTDIDAYKARKRIKQAPRDVDYNSLAYA
jgi:hypothetical protein